MTLDDATAFVRRLRAAAKSLVFTNGVFDLLHPGHVRYLQQARALGDALIVGVNSDRSARSNKGRSRPIIPAVERAEVLEALACVDGVVVFDEDTPQALIAALDMVEGTYKLDVAVHKRDGYPYDYHRLLYTFRVKSRTHDVGIYRPHHTWSFSPTVRFK